jgi:thiol-disulfide isomerase/thioredoxin
VRYSKSVNKKLLIIAVAIGVLLTAGIIFVVANKMNNQEKVSETAESVAPEQSAEPQEVAPADTITQPQPGVYKDYNAAVVAETKGVKILFFHAQWCPQCRQLDAEIKSGQIPENVTIFKVNYDSAQGLRQKYGVTLQTTLVKIDDSGDLIKKYVAYDDPTLAALIKQML